MDEILAKLVTEQESKGLKYKVDLKNQKIYMGILVVLTIWQLFSIREESIGFLVFRILFSLFMFLILFIDFGLRIDPAKIQYDVLLIKFTIYKKEVSAKDIEKIHFKRANWNTRGAIIHLKKGMNIRIIGFTPKDAYNQLERFTDIYELPVSKTKDYKILEKLR